MQHGHQLVSSLDNGGQINNTYLDMANFIVPYFVLRKSFRIGNYLLLTGRHICHFLMEGIRLYSK